MKMPSPTLLPLALALLLVLPGASAQQITTSHGLRTLSRIDAMQGEAQLRQAIRIGEETLGELLQDLAASERQGSTYNSTASRIPDQVKAANADYARAKTAFDQSNQRYLDELSAFQQRQVALQADVERQRAAGAAISPAMPLEQYNKAVADVNAWATRIANERTAIEAEQRRLQAEHDQIDAERSKLEQSRRDSEARLKQVRDTTTSAAGATSQKSAEIYRQLKVAADYVRDARARLGRVSKIPLAPSPLLEQATAKLKARPGG
jgi:chromosome segregation ATPase